MKIWDWLLRTLHGDWDKYYVYDLDPMPLPDLELEDDDIDYDADEMDWINP